MFLYFKCSNNDDAYLYNIGKFNTSRPIVTKNYTDIEGGSLIPTIV